MTSRNTSLRRAVLCRRGFPNHNLRISRWGKGGGGGSGTTKDALKSLVDERGRDAIDDVKSNLPFYAGTDTDDKDACASLEDWLSQLEKITSSGRWDDQLARERLLGEAVDSGDYGTVITG